MATEMLEIFGSIMSNTFMKSILQTVIILFLFIGANHQDKNQPKLPPGITKEMQEKINKAIDKGGEYLESKIASLGKMHHDNDLNVLVLWTLLHAGYPVEHEVVQPLLKKVLDAELKRTYTVAIQALCLNKIDKKKYQGKIAQCAQFLADNQCANGQWSYGEAVPVNEELETPQNKEKVIETPVSNKDKDKKDKSNGQSNTQLEPVKRIDVPKRQKGPPTGDNSNSQYAALGIRACYEAGIVLPDEVIKKAKKWWESTIRKDNGWNYKGDGEVSYGSMTAGAVGSLVIYKQILGEDIRNDRFVLGGFTWMVNFYTFKENPNADKMRDHDSKAWHYYYLYAFERACGLYGTDTVGQKSWYKEGAEFLLSKQEKDGSWSCGKIWLGDNLITDTCFAILFLQKATKPVEKPVYIYTDTKPKK